MQKTNSDYVDHEKWEEKFDKNPSKKLKKHKVSGKSVFDIQKIITKNPAHDKK